MTTSARTGTPPVTPATWTSRGNSSMDVLVSARGNRWPCEPSLRGARFIRSGQAIVRCCSITRQEKRSRFMLARQGLAAAVSAAAAVATAGLAAAPAAGALGRHDAAFLSRFHKIRTVASTVPFNGDVNPYG